MTGPEQRTFRHEVGARLRHLRDAAGWTQGKLARVAGVCDRAPVDSIVLARLADALRVPVDRLTGDDDTG